MSKIFIDLLWKLDAYDYASNVMVENMLKFDSEEGLAAFIEKRTPNWQDK